MVKQNSLKRIYKNLAQSQNTLHKIQFAHLIIIN